MRKKLSSILLALAMLLAALPLSVSADATFLDVPAGTWYSPYVEAMVAKTPGVINGYGDGSFHPMDNVKRGEFLKMIMEAAVIAGASGYRSTTERDAVHWAGKYYTIAMDNNALMSDVYSGGILFDCTFAELEKPITRYEIAVIVSNVTTNMLYEKTAVYPHAEEAIGDYDEIPEEFVSAVEQVCGKGIMNGFSDTPGVAEGSFLGGNNLRRCEAAKVVYLVMWDGERTMPDAAYYPEAGGIYVPEDFVPFAVRYQSMTEAERRIALFGDANKTYFANAAEAEPYMVTVEVPIWTLDANGNKIESAAALTVHRLVALEVQLIFREIFDDPERFPIYGGWSIGGSRYSDTMRHAWGCAIDINAYYNCECTTNWSTGSTRVTCGYGWWPVGTGASTFSGSMSGPSPYSIGAGSSVVRAFAKYGWGWGGQGYTPRADGSQKFDFMHFSILPSGG